jgi:hypothetical protein
MSGRSLRIAVPGALALLAAGAACRHHADGNMPARDTSVVQGVVSVTGTSFEQQLRVQTDGRSVRLLATPTDSIALTRLSGVEVAVRGTASDNGWRVASFTATRVDGAAVVDGVLRVDGPRLVLETTGGRLVLGNPPAPLRGMVGARVWISGPLDTGPNSYGVIVPAR